MHTAILKNIDGYSVVHGFSSPAVDPEATKAAVKLVVQGSSECNQVKSRIAVLAGKIKMIRVSMAKLNGEGHKVKRSESPNKDKLMKRLEAKYFAQEEKLEELTKELIRENQNLKPIINQILAQNIQYFEAAGSDTPITDEKYEELSRKLASLKEGEKLDIDGTVLIDKRNTVWAKKTNNIWSNGIIEKLNEDLPSGSKLRSSLTEEETAEISAQRDSDRIKMLSQSEKDKELEGQKEAIKNKAAIMKSRFEIEDDPSALSKAKAWLSREKTALEAKYQ